MSSVTAEMLSESLDEESQKTVRGVIERLKTDVRGGCTSPTWCDASSDCWGCPYDIPERVRR